MPLGRFFRRQSQPSADAQDESAEPAEADAELDAQATDQDDSSDYDHAGEAPEPEYELDSEAMERSWRRRAADVIPGGTSTGSKRPAALFGETNEVGPTHFSRATGCTLITPSDARLIDCTMALGAVAIGYADEQITRAVLMAAAAGNVAGLAHTSEVEVAERLVEIIPCAEQVRFMKSGAEGVAAALRIARTATGRSQVVGCGYFGWLDWAATGNGIPAGARADFHQVPFDDLPALEHAVRAAGPDLAAVVIEPVLERLPSTDWIAGARQLCDEVGAVLIFDEMKTGFRLRPGGYQEYANVLPDLAVFGKAMANGYPVSAVVGRKDVMSAATKTWISSTLAGEAVALAAVAAVLDRHESEDVCASLASIGAQMRESLSNAIAASGVSGIEVAGVDPMWLLRFGEQEKEQRFLELAVDEGVLFKRGAYNYPALAHGEEEVLVEIERAASSALVALREERGE